MQTCLILFRDRAVSSKLSRCTVIFGSDLFSWKAVRLPPLSGHKIVPENIVHFDSYNTVVFKYREIAKQSIHSNMWQRFELSKCTILFKVMA